MEAGEIAPALRAAPGGGCFIELSVEPGSKRPGLSGMDGWRGRLRLGVSSPAREGRANREVVQRLSDALGIEAARVSVHRGARSRQKTVLVESMALEAVAEALAPLVGEGRDVRR